MISQYFLSILNLAGLMALTAISFIGASRLASKGMAQKVMVGAILGFGAVAISLQPIMHVSGIQIDPRNLFVGISAAIFGPLAGVVTFVIAAATRYHQAAPSAYVCIFSLFVAGCAGLGWRRYTRNVGNKRVEHFIALGLIISISYLSTFLLPRESWRGVFSSAVPVLIATNLAGALVLGGILERHRQQQEREQRLTDQASRDPLTGARNRRAFEKEYGTSVISKPSSGAAFIIVDLDLFKNINDSHGHAVGDRVLVGISKVLQRSIRGNDLSARYGGDEFVISLSNVGVTETTVLIKRIRKEISRFGQEELEIPISLTVSIGVFWSENPQCLEVAFEIADQSLRQAKLNGRNQVVFNNEISFTPMTPTGISSRRSGFAGSVSS